MTDQRKYFIYAFFALTGLIYLSRLFYLQILDKTYETATNSIRTVVEIPFRGLIYDRKGKTMVYNTPVYDLYVTPKKVKISDTLAFCNLLGITRTGFDSVMTQARTYSKHRPSLFLDNLTKEEYARVQDAMVDYSGFEFVKSAVRSYETTTMSNALGYVSEVSEKQIEDQETEYYRSGDLIGQSGLEKFYEEALRGQRGVHYVMRDVNGVEKGSWKNGAMDTLMVAGQNLHTSINLELQQYCDSLLKNKVGAIVAIEPASGEILAIASGPTYDPNLLASRDFSKNYTQLYRNPYKPLYNRAIQSYYRPGSTFKTVQALVAMQEGAIGEGSVFTHAGCPMGCHCRGKGSGGVRSAIQWSCNAYFYHTFKRMIYLNGAKNVFKASEIGIGQWSDHVKRFGFSGRLGIDLPSEGRGILPDVPYYDKYLGKGQWRFGQIYSVSIGEGEVTITPLKVANLAATIANRGWFITPHIVRGIGKDNNPLPQFKEKHETNINKHYYEVVIDGMERAVVAGTTNKAAILPGVQICGKTGTSQNKYGEDHAIFMAFAPKYNPKIAVAVFVENAGYGGTHAAPLASLIIEKHLNGVVKRQKMSEQFINKNYMGRVVIIPERTKKDTTSKH